MTPFYVRGSVPERKELMRLVGLYFQAWVQQTSEPMADVFTSTAVYEEKPGVEAPILGIDGIRSYWDKNPGQQKNLDIGVHNVAYSDTVAVCSFGGDFDTPRQHIHIQGSINFYFDPYLGKFHRLTEYFGTVKTPHAI